MISVHELTRRFGGVTAVDGVSLDIAAGRVTGLIGPNGAGKTTLFDCIAGTLRPDAGRVTLAGEDITGLPPHALFARGVLRTFQIAREFGSLTVRDNLRTVPAGQPGESLLSACLRPGRSAAREREITRRADEVVEFLNLGGVADELAGNLSGGQKKLLELGRTLMVEPRIVFLDEVGAGVNRTLLAEIGDAILRLNRERGLTFCLIEHDMGFVSRLCDEVVVLAEGRVLARGAAGEVQRDERVIEAYLGGGTPA